MDTFNHDEILWKYLWYAGSQLKYVFEVFEFMAASLIINSTSFIFVSSLLMLF